MKIKILSLISLLLLSIFLCSIPLKKVAAIPLYEDYTTYTEVDPNNHIDTTSQEISLYYAMNEDAYLYDDKGASYFVNFTHHFDAKWDNKTSSAYNGIPIWMTANDLDDGKGLKDASKDFFAVFFAFTGSPATLRIQLVECDAGTTTVKHHIGISHQTWYYMTVKRFGTANITLEIYSDSARTSLLESLNITSCISTNFRYIYGCNTWRNGQARYGWVFLQNLTLGEQDQYYLTFYRTEGGLFRVDGETTTNGTQNIYWNGTIIEFSALTYNVSWLFVNYTFGASHNDTNPYNYTVTENKTVWLYFRDPPLDKLGIETTSAVLFIGTIFLIAIPVFLFFLLFYYRRK